MAEEKEKKIEELEKELKECQKLKEEYLNGWKRERADFLNYKREEKERLKEVSNLLKEDLILKILPTLDNFEIIEKKLPEKLKKDEYVKGIFRIKNQILDFLKKEGLEEMELVGQKFDPNLAEIVEAIEKEGLDSGVIVEEVKKGYKLNGRLLRPARVKVVK